MGAWADGHRAAYELTLGDAAPHPLNQRTEKDAEEFYEGMLAALRIHGLRLSLFLQVIPLDRNA